MAEARSPSLNPDEIRGMARALPVFDHSVEIARYIEHIEHAGGRNNPASQLELQRLRTAMEDLLAQIATLNNYLGILPTSNELGTTFVNNLPDVDVKDVESGTCDICMEPFARSEDCESAVQLPCGHIMGRQCISKWLESSNSCPLCRRVLFENPVPRATDREEEWGVFPVTLPRAAVRHREFWDLYSEFSRRQNNIQHRLAGLERPNVRLTRGRARELRVNLLSERQRWSEEWDDFSERFRDLIDLYRVRRPVGVSSVL